MKTTNTQTHNKDLRDDLLNLFSGLPQKLQDGIVGEDLRNKVSSLSKKHGLSEAELVSLENEVLSFLLTINTEKELLANLRKEMLNKARVDSIYNDIQKEIIEPIEKELVLEETARNEKDTRTISQNVSQNLSQKIKALGEKHNLRVDRLGVLEDEITKRLSGKVTSADFHRDIQKRLGLSNTERDQLVKDVNETIFNKIREKLKEKKGSEERLDRETILREIENDMPQAQSSDKDPKAFLKENVVEEEPKIKPEEGELFEDKLKEASNEEKKPGRNTYKGGVDPYREIID